MARDRSDGRRPPAAFVAVAAVVCLSLVSAAPAAARTDREKARAKLAEGVRFLESDKPEEALAQFKEAYALVPSPNLHYNMALANERLNRLAEAYTGFERFAREAIDGSPEHLRHARLKLEQLSSRVGFVAIETNLSGGDLRIDGRPVGSTPLQGTIPVDPGTHEAVISKSDLGEVSKPFTAVAGRTTTLRIEFPRTPDSAARLPVTTLPVLPAPSGREVGSDLLPRGDSSVLAQRDELGETDRAPWRRLAGYGLLAAGVIGVGSGTYLLMRDEDGCGEPMPGGFMCRYVQQSDAPGWVLLGAGIGLALGGGIVLYAGRDVQVAMMAGPGSVALKGAL